LDEIETLHEVAEAADRLVAELGAKGEITTLHPRSQELLNRLHEWKPI